MTTFEPSTSSKKSDSGAQIKYSLHRLQPTVQKFIKVLQIDLDRLQRHKENIEKLKHLSNWEGLKREQINASRTVQQLKANIAEMEKTRIRINEEDVREYDKQTESIRLEAHAKVLEFLEIYIPPSPEKEIHGNENDKMSSSTYSNSSSQPDIREVEQLQLLQQERQEQKEAEQTWENLKDDLLELNGLMEEFSKLVFAQKEKVDSIEDNVEKAQENVVRGTKLLSKAAKYKAAMFPVAGALIGSVVGGPVGFVAGFKLGVASAIGGGIIGLTGGSILKKQVNKINDLEMKRLENNRRSTSMPEELDKIK